MAQWLGQSMKQDPWNPMSPRLAGDKHENAHMESNNHDSGGSVTDSNTTYGGKPSKEDSYKAS
jgi:hypothetical protein